MKGLWPQLPAQGAVHYINTTCCSSFHHRYLQSTTTTMSFKITTDMPSGTGYTSITVEISLTPAAPSQAHLINSDQTDKQAAVQRKVLAVMPKIVSEVQDAVVQPKRTGAPLVIHACGYINIQVFIKGGSDCVPFLVHSNCQIETVLEFYGANMDIPDFSLDSYTPTLDGEAVNMTKTLAAVSHPIHSCSKQS